jgi:hypothetical protein
MVAERACIDRSGLTRAPTPVFGGGRSSLRSHPRTMAESSPLEGGNDVGAW